MTSLGLPPLAKAAVSVGGSGGAVNWPDSRISPARPAMMNRRSPNATPPRLVSVPELRRNHALPSGEVSSVPLAPTVRNIPPPNVTSLSHSVVPDLEVSQRCPLSE